MEAGIRQKEQEIQQWQLKYFGPEGHLYSLQNELLAPILQTIDKIIRKSISIKGSFSHNYKIWNKCIELQKNNFIDLNLLCL